MPNNSSVVTERTLNALEAIQAAQEAIVASQALIAAAADSFDVTYVFPVKDFGAATWTEDIQGAPGMRGLVKCISAYDITEAFNGDTTEARVEVGIQGGDADAYSISADFVEGAGTGIAAGFTPVLTAGVVGTIPAGEDLLVTGYAPDDSGANAGIATIALTIAYFV